MSIFERLPPELMAHLFVTATSSDSVMPSTICLVCWQWRSIAMETPELWSKIVFDSTSYNEDSSCSFVKQAEWLKRSQSALLTIEFRELQAFKGYGMLDVQRNVNGRLLDLITPHAHRWRNLKATSSDLSGMDWKLFAALDGLETPALETVFIESDRPRPRNIARATPRFGSILRPKLRSLSIPTLALTSSSLALTPSLEYLSMCSHTWNWSEDSASESARKILSVLRIAKKLRNLEVLIYAMLWSEETLVDEDQHESYPQIFASGLEELHLSRRFSWNGLLQSQSERCQNPCLHRTCECLPSLEVVRFTRLTLDNSQLGALGEHCPKLVELHLTRCVMSGEEVLNQIVLSRHAAGWAPLGLLEVIYCETAISGVKLRKSQTEGLIQKIHIKPVPEV